MPAKLAVVFILFCALLSAKGQDLKAVTQHYKPGDTLRYRVEFEGDPKFDSVGMGFYLQGNVAPDQPGLSGYFSISHMATVKAGVFDVDGVIPATTANGTFEVRWVSAAISPASKQYEANNFHITIQIDNDAKYNFPPLKSVTPGR
jgi:hypothetical protein